MNAYDFLIGAQLARTELARSYEVGIIQKTPFPHIDETSKGRLAGLAKEAWTLKRNLDTKNETSHAFTLPALLQCLARTLAQSSEKYQKMISATEKKLADIQAEIDEIAFDLYEIPSEDRRLMQETAEPKKCEDTEKEHEPEKETDEEDENENVGFTMKDLISDLLSYTFGLAFSRFDMRKASGEIPFPPDPEPFDPLPAFSPGQLEDSTHNQSMAFPDDPGHPEDREYGNQLSPRSCFRDIQCSKLHAIQGKRIKKNGVKEFSV